jgi:hypothetical protein
LEYDPGSPEQAHLARGLWTVEYTTFEEDMTCGLRVDVQSGLQIYRRFDANQFSDDGGGVAILNFGIEFKFNQETSNLLFSQQLSTCSC